MTAGSPRPPETGSRGMAREPPGITGVVSGRGPHSVGDGAGAASVTVAV